MFTGIIKDVGTIVSVNRLEDIEQIKVRTKLALNELPLGASIAIDGVCLTQTAVESQSDGVVAQFDIGPETMKCTTLCQLDTGRRVHLEPALKYGDALDGHMVSGHVDTLGHVVERLEQDETLTLYFEVPEDYMRFIAIKGSIAINGTSLTINEVMGTRFQVTLIPHTLQETHFGTLQVGQAVNIEVDTIARYLDRLSKPYQNR